MNKTLQRICTTSSIVYALAWLIGLSSGGPMLKFGASGSAVVNGFVTHKSAALMQFLFTEGVAGLALLILVIAVLCGLRNKSGKLSNWAKLFGVTGIIASLISLVMAGVSFVLILSVAPHGTADHAKELFGIINRIDGPKMWLLGIMAISGIKAVPKLPSWLKITGYMLAASLAISGLSYLLLIQSLTWAVYIALILLLIWVSSFGGILGSRKHSL